MIQVHKSIFSSLQHAATWAAVSVPLWTFGGQLDKPWSTAVYGIATLCSVISIFLAPPKQKDDGQ